MIREEREPGQSWVTKIVFLRFYQNHNPLSPVPE